MPGYKGHIVGGAVAFGLLFFAVQYKQPSLYMSLEWLCFALMGALFPDIDTKSKGQGIFYTIILISSLWLFLQQQFLYLSLVLFASLLPLLVRHRGILHNIWFILGLQMLFIIYIKLYIPQFFIHILYNCAFFSIGVCSHLMLDLGVKRMWRW